MISYGWVTEQSFIDLLTFLFLQIMCFRPKKSRFYLLVVLQVLIFAFTVVNYGEFIFQPFIERFSPSLLSSLQVLIPTLGSTIWAIRRLLDLVVSVYLGLFLPLLVRTSSDVQKPDQDHPVDKIQEAKI